MIDVDRFKLMMDAYKNFQDDITCGTHENKTNINFCGHILSSTMYRCGIVMGIRANHVGHVCGVMIISSHISREGNAIRLVDCTGDVLSQEWKDNAIQCICAKGDCELMKLVGRLHNKYPPIRMGTVLIGYDLRSTGGDLYQACRQGVKTVKGCPFGVGQVTIPELHHHVTAQNHFSQSCYLTNLLEVYSNTVQCSDNACESNFTCHVDCAYGIGASKLSILKTMLREKNLHVILYNKEETKRCKCGVEYVYRHQKVPLSMDVEGELCCSFDEDVDRLLFYISDEHASRAFVLNGDAMSCLFIKFIGELCIKAGVHPSICWFYDALTNGSYVSCVKASTLNVTMLPHSVKDFDTSLNQAREFDIGVCFEQDGYGTVVFSKRFIDSISDNVDATQLVFISTLLNQHTSDALANFLFVMTILQQKGLWYWLEMYKELPWRIERTMASKCMFKRDEGNWITLRFVSDAVQKVVDDIISACPKSRLVITPCANSDLIKVYVEAETVTDVNLIMDKVFDIIHFDKNLNYD